MAIKYLSVVIPTRNREETLVDLLTYFINNDLSFVEIIVEDNSDRVNEKVRKLNNSAIKYYHTSEMRTMRQNCEHAVSRSSGEYVCMIGDDDGILIPEALDVIENMKRFAYDFSLSPDATYYWPGLKRRLFGTRNYGFSQCYKQCMSRIIDPRRELYNVFKVGGVKILGLPRLYQGIVKKSILEEIKSNTSNYFNAPMPDMSSSVALAYACESGYLHCRPFIINGVSNNSGGGKGAAGKHQGTVEEGYGLSLYDIYKWPKIVPRVWTGGTVWAASLVTTLESIGCEKYIKLVNINAMHGYLLAFHYSLTKKVLGRCHFNCLSIYVAFVYIADRLISLLYNSFVYIKLFIGLAPKFKNISSYLTYVTEKNRGKPFS